MSLVKEQRMMQLSQIRKTLNQLRDSLRSNKRNLCLNYGDLTRELCSMYSLEPSNIKKILKEISLIGLVDIDIKNNNITLK